MAFSGNEDNKLDRPGKMAGHLPNYHISREIFVGCSCSDDRAYIREYIHTCKQEIRDPDSLEGGMA